MANLQENYNTRRATGVPLPSRILDIMDTTPGLTDALYAGGVKSAFGDTAPAWVETAEIDDEPGVPTLDVVLSKLGVKAEKDPTGIKAARKFVDEFADKQGVWKKKITKDPAWGERGWETVKDLFKQISSDLMQYDIVEARKQAAHDAPLRIAGHEFKDPIPDVTSFIAGMVAPRSKKAIEEGRSPETNEVLRDAAANALYAVPFGTVARSIAPASLVLRYGSQAVAPALVAGMDKAVDPNYTLSDAAWDASLGTAANLGVNRWLAPKLGQYLGTLRGGISRKIPSWARAALEDMPTARDMAETTVAKASEILAAPKKTVGEVANDIASGAMRGASTEEKATAQAILDIYKASQGKIMGAKPADELKAAAEAAMAPPATGKDVGKLVGGIVAGSKAPFKDINPASPDPEALFGAVKTYMDDWGMYTKVLESNPELMSLFSRTPMSRAFYPANLLKTYTVNQVGSTADAPAHGAISAATFGAVDSKKIQKENREAKEKSAASASISKILEGASELTAEDELYLRRIKDNPDLLRFSQDDGLKSWLLRRGHRLLQGTAAHRPLWEVR